MLRHVLIKKSLFVLHKKFFDHIFKNFYEGAIHANMIVQVY